jgi:hypothetical protein
VAPIIETKRRRGQSSFFILGKKGTLDEALLHSARYCRYITKNIAMPPIAKRDTLNEMGDISVRAISARIKLAPQKKTNNTSRP